MTVHVLTHANPLNTTAATALTPNRTFDDFYVTYFILDYVLSVCLLVPVYLHFVTVMFLQKQDHYAVLGLSKLRFRATADQIKRACE